MTLLQNTLLDAIPENTTDDKLPFVADFALLLAPPFLALYRAIAADAGGEWWLRGGCFSLKSSTVSLEIAAGLMEHEDRSAFVMPKIGKDIGEGVFEQMLWALSSIYAMSGPLPRAPISSPGTLQGK